MLASSRRFCLCVSLAILLAGCESPATRARQHPAAFTMLSPADRKLVLHGHVRTGLAREAVLIAWGEPDRKIGGGDGDGGKSGPSGQIWIYHRQLTIHAGIGSYDQWQPGNSLVSWGRPLGLHLGYGFGGSDNAGWLFTRPRVQPTDSYVRRAVFLHGMLDDYRTTYGEVSPLP